MTDYNFNLEGTGVSEQEISDILNEAVEISEELRSNLSSIRVFVSGAEQPTVVSAIGNLFGSENVTSTGDSYITYDMYCTVLNLLRTVGSATAKEAIL